MKAAISIGLLLALSLTLLAAQVQSPEATPAQPQPIGSSAIWQPAKSLLNSVKKECSQAQYPNFDDCFVAQMEKNGAPADAVAFARLIGGGFMRDFRKAGRVDIAYISYPFRANANQACLLVNGDPNVVDVDDSKLWPQELLAKDPTYTALAKKYPKISVWPGGRSGTAYPKATALSTGGQNFIVSYYLQNGCLSCARVGTASFGFHFDISGKFAGTKLAGVQAGSADPSSSGY
ncbi:MAG: hypothetical protein WBC04_12525 [Candidatus Acidiferrales bacterium]